MFRLIRSRVTDFFAIMAGVLVGAALHRLGFPWALDGALCVAYTVKVLGLGLTDRGAKVFSSDPSRSWLKILLMHAGFLVAVVAIARVGVLLFPVHLRTAADQPRPINWGLLMVIFAIYFMAYSEVRLLFHKPKTKSPSAAMPSGGFEPMAEQVAFPFVAPVAIPASPAVVSAPLFQMPAAPEVAAAPIFERAAEPAPAVEEPTAGGSIAAGVYSVAESDEHEAFLLYMHQKEREFRKPGVSVKEEYEQWCAHRRAMLSGTLPKKKKILGLF